MSKLTTIFLFLFVVWLFFPVSKSNATPPEKRSDIIKLLKINGSKHMATKMAIYASNQVIDVLKKNEKELTPRTIEIIREENLAILKEQIADDQAFFSYLIPIYDKYYTHSEIKGLISFWDSELGRKSVQIMPPLMDDLLAAGEKWAISFVPTAILRIIKRLEAEGIKVK